MPTVKLGVAQGRLLGVGVWGGVERVFSRQDSLTQLRKLNCLIFWMIQIETTLVANPVEKMYNSLGMFRRCFTVSFSVCGAIATRDNCVRALDC